MKLLCSWTHCIVLHISWGALTGIDWAGEHKWASWQPVSETLMSHWPGSHCSTGLDPPADSTCAVAEGTSVLSALQCSSRRRRIWNCWSRFILKNLAVLFFLFFWFLRSIRTWGGNSSGRRLFGAKINPSGLGGGSRSSLPTARSLSREIKSTK